MTDFTSFRLIVAYGHAKHWLIKQYDIVLAFTCARPQTPTFVPTVMSLVATMSFSDRIQEVIRRANPKFSTTRDALTVRRGRQS